MMNWSYLTLKSRPGTWTTMNTPHSLTRISGKWIVSKNTGTTMSLTHYEILFSISLSSPS